MYLTRFSLQLKLSTKLSAKDMAVFINEELKPKEVSAKDEL